MNAWKIAAIISCCWIPASGCSICQHPYYDCGPVWSRDACPNCNPDYRAGSILNRDAPGGPFAEGVSEAGGRAPRVVAPASRAAESARVAAQRAERSETQIRAAALAPQPHSTLRTPAERQTPPMPTSTVLSEAPLPGPLPPRMAAAPPGTKEGAVKVLSVTDHRLDELQRVSKALTVPSKSPQQTGEKPSQDLGGWRPVTPRQDSPEAANQMHEVER